MQRVEQEQVFREWVAAYQGILVHVARGFAAGADREDLVQEMLLALWHAVPRFRGDAAPATYIYRIAQNTALTWRRREMRQPPAARDVDATTVAAPEVSPRIARTEALYRAVRRLPELDRALLLLYLDEVPYRDIADILGLSVSNVGVRLNRARPRLAVLVQEETA